MVTMQQSVSHLDHSGMPSQSQMAHTQQTASVHSQPNPPQPEEESAYKSQRHLSSSLSPATYSNLTPTHNSLQYAQQHSQYTNLSALLPDNIVEDTTSKKDDLLKQIRMVDANINKVEGMIQNLRKKEEKLKEAACLPNGKDEDIEVQAQQPKYHSLAQEIYAENRRKARKDTVMEKFGIKIERVPLYNQPSDTKVYHENIKKHADFKNRLLLSLRAKIKKKNLDEIKLTETYSRLFQEWRRKVEIIENSAKRKAKDAKNRELFEKVFPELRKQKEDRERFSRVGGRMKNETTLEEITDRLQEQESKMRSLTIIPPFQLSSYQRQYRYIDNNGRIENFATEYKERQVLNVWTKAEIEIFNEKFLQHPKNFGVIASFLDRKSAPDCVQYYYHSKQKENYKRLLRKSRQRTRSSRNPYGKVHNVSGVGRDANATNDPMDSILSSVTGVTTRLQREQLQKQVPSAPLLPPAPLENPSTPSTINCDTLTEENNVGKENITATPVSDVAATSPFCDAITNTNTPPTATTTGLGEDSVSTIDTKMKEKKKEKKKKKKEALDEITNEEIPDTQKIETMQSCTLCKNYSQCTRALLQSHATQYGLQEHDIPIDAKVCSTCRRKSLRSRYAHCPLPSCPNSKGHRVKRLRALPMNWPELPQHIKDPIIAEFRIPPNVSKCCSVCFYHIGRRLMPLEDSMEKDSQNHTSQLFCWTEEETENFKRALRDHGNQWSEVARVVGLTKTQQQCKNFFSTYKKKFGLDKILQDYNKAQLGEECRLDDGESSSSMSSNDIAGTTVFDDSDTASADSPINVDCTQSIEKGKEEENDLLGIVKVDISERDNVDTSSLSSHKEKYSFSTISVDNVKRDEEPAEIQPVQEVATTSSSLTVSDIMLTVIETQLMKPDRTKVSSASIPTQPPYQQPHSLYSMLLNDSPKKSGLSSTATLSAIGSNYSQTSDLPKESSIIQMQLPMQESKTEGTLDLSIKKPRSEYRESGQTKHSTLASPHSVSVYKTVSTHSGGYQRVASPQLSSKLSPDLMEVGGSILHGTPVTFHSTLPTPPPTSRYDSSPILRQMTPPATKEASAGSITRGTPVHQRGIYPGLGRSEYSNNGGGKRPTSNSQGLYTRPSVYSVEQQQIIMNDYITSQQMPERSTRRTYEKTPYFQPHQGVIKLHSTKPSSPNHCPPGHEAFSNLVDVAIRLPSLPVPVPLPQYEDKRLLQKGFEERFNRDNTQNRFGSRDQERFTRENNKIHNRSISTNHQHQPIQLQQQQQRHLLHQQQIRDPQILQPIHHHREHRENIPQLFHHHQQRELEHHRLGHIQMPADYPPPREESAPHMTQFPRKPLQSTIPVRPNSEAMGEMEGNSNSVMSGGNGTCSNSDRANQGGSDSSTVTAASLIDAIVTHQINHSNSDVTSQAGNCVTSQAGMVHNPSALQSRSGDRLFQVFHGEGSEANGKVSPVKSGLSMARSPDPKQGSLNLGDHIESIMNRNYPPTLHHSQLEDYESPQAWKFRRGFQQQELDQGQALRKKNDNNIVKMASPPSTSPRTWYYEQPIVPLSPLDYVKNRIAEVMRTSGEEGSSKIGGGENPSGENMVIYEGEERVISTVKSQATTPFIATSAAYMYPFSALGLNVKAPPVPVSFAKNTQKQPTDSIPEPAPLLSAQYESLSDED